MRPQWRHHRHLRSWPFPDQIASAHRGLASNIEKSRSHGDARTPIVRSESTVPYGQLRTTKNRQFSADRPEPNAGDHCGGPKIASCCRTGPATSPRICRRPTGNGVAASNKLRRFWSLLQSGQGRPEPLRCDLRFPTRLQHGWHATGNRGGTFHQRREQLTDSLPSIEFQVFPFEKSPTYGGWIIGQTINQITLASLARVSS